MLIKADLHIHTVLSPCANIEMSPRAIIQKVKEKGIRLIGIADHNTTRQCRTAFNIGKQEGIHVIPGAEVNTKEEVHCLAFFETFEQADEFESFIDLHLPDVRYDPYRFGQQVMVDEFDNITGMHPKFLINAINVGISEVEKEIHRLGGLFIPSHIDRPRNSLMSQLGFVPDNLNADAFEISKYTHTASFLEKNPSLVSCFFIKNSDAHYLRDIGTGYTEMEVDEISFKGLQQFLKEKKS